MKKTKSSTAALPLDPAIRHLERYQQMAALIQYSLEILSSVGTQEILRQTVRAAALLTRAEVVWLAIEHSPTRTLAYQMVHPPRDIALPSPEEYPAQPISSLLWGGGTGTIDPETSYSLEVPVPKQVVHPMEGPIHAILAVPLRYGSHTVGVLEAINKMVPEGFTRADRDNLTLLAKFATNAVTNAQVLDETMHLFENSLVLQAEKAHQEQIANLRARFTQQLAHELRNQMGIVNMAVKQFQLHPERATETIRTIEACNYLEEMLLADVLDQAQIDSGAFSLRKHPLDLHTFFAPLQRIYATLAEDSDKTLTWEIPTTPLLVEADTKRLSQIMTNLLSNAMKYSRANGRINVQVTMTGDDGRAVRIAVSDNGVGIPVDQQPCIFQRGFRGQPDLAGGEGLGLYFVQYLVQEHNGEIGFTSRPGRGSEFYFTLPVAPYG